MGETNDIWEGRFRFETYEAEVWKKPWVLNEERMFAFISFEESSSREFGFLDIHFSGEKGKKEQNVGENSISMFWIWCLKSVYKKMKKNE